MSKLCKYCKQFLPETKEHWYYLHGEPFFHKMCYNEKYRKGYTNHIRTIITNISAQIDLLDQIHETLLNTEDLMIVGKSMGEIRTLINHLNSLVK